MKMYALNNGKYINPSLVTCCYVNQVERNIFQVVFEFGNEYQTLCSHSTGEDANKDLADFIAFCEDH